MLKTVEARNNESYQIAARLAARLGLERVYPVDDHTGDNHHIADRKAFGQSIEKAWKSDRARLDTLEAREEKLMKADDLLPLYRHINHPIFLALGMWNEVVSQNEVAAGRHRSRWRAGHSTHWLTYGYVQQGRFAAARGLIALLVANAGSPPAAYPRGQLANFRARYVLDSEDWNGPEATSLVADTGFAGEDGYEYATFAAGYAAARRGDAALAERMLDRLRRVNGRAASTVTPGAVGSTVVPVILELALHAELLRGSGAREEAIALLRRATALEDGMPAEFGPPAVVKPSHELLAALLLESGRAADAVAAFQRALELGPGRSAALLGLARAARAAGQGALATETYRTLAANWHAADTAFPALAEARGGAGSPTSGASPDA
jgi:tetratricopeptide (TPR) repeat protein